MLVLDRSGIAIEDDAFALPEIGVGTWAGFVFVNPDPNAEPLEEHLADIAEQFEAWDLASYYKEAHVARVVPANWK